MPDTGKKDSDFRELREKAEQIVRERHEGNLEKGEADLVHLINELEVYQIESGEEALELARQLSPDVIIMDISMPGMGGVEATRLIKAENPEIRVIGLSMFAEEDIFQKMREAGANGFVSKSESSSELLKAIYDVAG